MTDNLPINEKQKRIQLELYLYDEKIDFEDSETTEDLENKKNDYLVFKNTRDQNKLKNKIRQERKNNKMIKQIDKNEEINSSDFELDEDNNLKNDEVKSTIKDIDNITNDTIEVSNKNSKRHKTQQLCIEDECYNLATFGSKYFKLGLYCQKHTLPRYIDIKHKLCQTCNKARANYGIKGTKEPIHCYKHRLDNEINLVPNKKCIFEKDGVNCNITARYGTPNTTEKLYCEAHKPDGYLNNAVVKCNFKDGCNIRANFAPKGSTKPLTCEKHAGDDYINVRAKLCIHPNCTVSANYIDISTGEMKYCNRHRPTDIETKIKNTCKAGNCTKSRLYGFKGKSKLYCKEHKLDGMIYLSKKKCELCDKNAHYGVPDSKIPIRCQEHKDSSHVRIGDDNCTQCNRKAGYGFIGQKLTACSDHKTDGMLSKKQITKARKNTTTCPICEETIIAIDNYCPSCKNYIEVNKTESKVNITVKGHFKELGIKKLLEDNQFEFIHNRTIPDDESKRRPDFRIKTKNGHIIIEVDEFQHSRRSSDYNCECEITRMKQIYHGLKEPNLLFIRYNPDNYKPSFGNVQTELERHKTLLKYLRYYMNNEIENLKVLYLFYDGYISHNTDLDNIDPYGD